VLIDPTHLRDLGWDASFDEAFAPHAGDGLVPARVAVQHRGEYVLYAAAGELRATLAGRLRGDHVIRIPGKLAYARPIGALLPTVGDWVAVATQPGDDRGTIQAILARRTEFSRKAPLVTQRQVLAANVDTVFVVAALIPDSGDPSSRRSQRRARSRGLAAYIAMAHQSGAQPVILLTKADLLADTATAASEHADLGVPVILTSAVTGRGLDLVRGSLLSIHDASAADRLALGRAKAAVESDLSQLEGERAELVDTLRRVQADFENYRKRVSAQQHADIDRAVGKVVEALLPVLDACEAAFTRTCCRPRRSARMAKGGTRRSIAS